MVPYGEKIGIFDTYTAHKALAALLVDRDDGLAVLLAAVIGTEHLYDWAMAAGELHAQSVPVQYHYR